MQVAGKLTGVSIMGERKAKRLVAYLQDSTGEIELTWFQGINWIEKTLNTGHQYLVFGRLGYFNSKPQIVHPEVEPYTTEKAGGKNFLDPIYPSTEKLKVRGLNGRAFAKLSLALLQQLSEKDLPESLPGKYSQTIPLYFKMGGI